MRTFVIGLSSAPVRVRKSKTIYLKNQSGLLLGIIYDPLLDPKGWNINGPISWNNRHLHHAGFDKNGSIVAFNKG